MLLFIAHHALRQGLAEPVHDLMISLARSNRVNLTRAGLVANFWLADGWMHVVSADYFWYS